MVLRGAKHLVALGLQFEVSDRYVTIDQCEDLCLYQTIAGNWQRQVPSLVHVTGGRNILLVNSAVCLADGVVSRELGGWNAGARSQDRSFARQSVWSAADAARTIDEFQEKLTRDLTPARAETLFGKPDQVLGSGLIIYDYHLGGGEKLRLGFPGYRPILYAKHVTANGTIRDMPLK